MTEHLEIHPDFTTEELTVHLPGGAAMTVSWTLFRVEGDWALGTTCVNVTTCESDDPIRVFVDDDEVYC